MNKNKLKRYNCFGEDGNINPVFQAIDCYEQIQFLEVNSLEIKNIESIFCDDVNFVYQTDKKNNRYQIWPNYLGRNKELFESVKIEVKNKEYYQIIKEVIDRGYSVIYRTMFDMLYPYCWYSENAAGVHDKHYGAIVDYDDEYYYFIDSPYVLDNGRNIVYNENNSINLITHEKLHFAFDKLCELSIIIIKEDSLDTLYPIEELINKIRFNYYESKIKISNYLIDYTGKQAYQKLLEDLKSDEFDYLYNSALISHFSFHLIKSRHILLEMCLINEKENNNIHRKKVISSLRNCINAWDKITFKVLLSNNHEVKDLKEKLVADMETICFLEDKMMQCL